MAFENTKARVSRFMQKKAAPSLAPGTQKLGTQEKLRQLQKIREFKIALRDGRNVGENDPTNCPPILSEVNDAITRAPQSRTGGEQASIAAYKDCFAKASHLHEGLTGVIGKLDKAAQKKVQREDITKEEAEDFPNRQFYLNYDDILTEEEAQLALATYDNETAAEAVAWAIDRKEQALEKDLTAIIQNPNDVYNWTDEEKVTHGIREALDETQEAALSEADKEKRAAEEKAALDKLAQELEEAKQRAANERQRFLLTTEIAAIESKIDDTSLVQGLINRQEMKVGQGVMSKFDYNTIFNTFGNVMFQMKKDPKNPEKSSVAVFSIPKLFRSMDAAGVFAGALINNLMENLGMGREDTIAHINKHGLPIEGIQTTYHPWAVMNFLADTSAVLMEMGVKQEAIQINWNLSSSGGDASKAQGIINRETGSNWGNHLKNAKARLEAKTDMNPNRSFMDKLLGRNKEGGHANLKEAVGVKYMGNQWHTTTSDVKHQVEASKEAAAQATTGVTATTAEANEPGDKDKAALNIKSGPG